jgi:translation initiation factor IF-1
MSTKEEFLEFEGVVTELLPEGRYRVQLDNEHMVLAYTAGRMKRNKIRTLVGRPGDRRDDPLRPQQGPDHFRHKTAPPLARRKPGRSSPPLTRGSPA